MQNKPPIEHGINRRDAVPFGHNFRSKSFSTSEPSAIVVDLGGRSVGTYGPRRNDGSPEQTPLRAPCERDEATSGLRANASRRILRLAIHQYRTRLD